MIKKLIYFFAFMLCIYNVKAKHILGGNIRYQQISNKTYKFTLELYRDCNDCKFDGNGGGNNPDNCSDIKELKIFSKDDFLSNNTQNPLGVVSLNRVSIENITNSCQIIKNSCMPNQNWSYGVEKHTLEGTFDLSKTSNIALCELYITVKKSARFNGLMFFNFAYLNTCNGISNSSPILKTNLPLLSFVDSKIAWSPNYIDPDGDSISYELVPGQISSTQNFQYKPGFTHLMPFPISCNTNCTVEPYTQPTSGVFLDKANGDLIYTPIVPTKGLFVIEAKEWRKSNLGIYSIVGKTRLDFQINVQNKAFNTPPIFSQLPLKYTACIGENGGFDFLITDKIYNGISNNIHCKLLTNLPDLSITTSMSTPNQGVVSLSWSDKTFIKAGEYSLLFELEDDGCPVHLKTYRRINFIVPEKKEYKFNLSVDQCGIINATIDGLKENAIYKVYKDGSLISDESSLEYKKLHLAAGVYRVDAFVGGTGDNPCVYQFSKSIVKNQTVLPRVDLPAQRNICYDDNVLFKPKSINGKGSLKFKWSSGALTRNMELKWVKKSTRIILKVTDINGCSAEDYTNLIVNELPKITFIDPLEFCGEKITLPINKIWSKGSDVASVKYTLIGQNGVTFPTKEIVLPKVGSYMFSMKVVGNNGCENSDVKRIELLPYPKISIEKVRDICSDELSISLFNESQVLPRNGIWEKGNDAVLRPDNIDVATLSVGKNLYKYKVNNRFCTSEVDLSLNVVDPPIITFSNIPKEILCPESDPMKIGVNLVGGKWSGDINDKGVIEPVSLTPGKKYKAIYTYVDQKLNACKAHNSFEFEIQDKPVITVQSLKDYWCFEDKKINFKLGIKEGSEYSYSVDDIGTFNDLNYSLTAKDGQKDFLNFKFSNYFGSCKPVVKEYIIARSIPETFNLKANKYRLCKGENVTIELLSKNKVVKDVKWKVNGLHQNLLSGINIKFGNLALGSNMISTEYQNKGCLGFSDSIAINVVDVPRAKLETNPEYKANILNPIFTLKDGTVFNGKYNRQWKVDNKVLIDKSKQVLYSFKQDTGLHNIQLQVNSIDGCKSSDQKVVYLSDGIVFYAPTAFVPFGEGPKVNDKFEIVVKNYKNFRIDIYSSWGSRVFSTTNPLEGWSGKVNGKMLPPDVFAYVVYITPLGSNKPTVFKGTVHLIY